MFDAPVEAEWCLVRRVECDWIGECVSRLYRGTGRRDLAPLPKIALLTYLTFVSVCVCACVCTRVCSGLFRKLRSGGLWGSSGAAALYVYVSETMKWFLFLCRPTFSLRPFSVPVSVKNRFHSICTLCINTKKEVIWILEPCGVFVAAAFMQTVCV